MFCQERRVCMLPFDLLKIAVFDLQLAEEVKIRNPTLIIAHVNRAAAVERSLY